MFGVGQKLIIDDTKANNYLSRAPAFRRACGDFIFRLVSKIKGEMINNGNLI